MVDGLFKVPDAPAESALPEEFGPTGRPILDLPVPASPTPSRDTRAIIVSMCNREGGVGETTVITSLGAALVGLGYKVLLVDFGPQGSFSVGLGVNPRTLECSVYSLLLSREYTVDEMIQPVSVEGMDVFPSSINLSAAEVQLVSEVACEQTLNRLLEPLRGEYDFTLIGCVSSLGLLTINAPTASNYVIVPLECEFFALCDIASLTGTISKISDRLDPNLEILGILGIMYGGWILRSREALERVIQTFGDDIFHAVIRRTMKLPETAIIGEPITAYTPASKGANTYRTLAREVLGKCR